MGSEIVGPPASLGGKLSSLKTRRGFRGTLELQLPRAFPHGGLELSGMIPERREPAGDQDFVRTEFPMDGEMPRRRKI
eukprot:s1929_g3.t1